MTIRRKTILVILISVALLVAMIAVLASIFVDPDRYRPEIISYLESKTGKQIEIGHIAVIWRPLSIRLDDFRTRNPKPFPPGYFFKAKRVDAALDASALLRQSHRHQVTHFV